MPGTAVIYAAMPTEIGSVAAYARLAERTSTRRLWIGQSTTIETHTVFAALAGMGFDLGYGSAVTVMPMRHPYTAAIDARSVAALSGRPYVAGIGPGAAVLQRRLAGAAYRTPVADTERYARMMRSLLDDETAKETEGQWPSEGIELDPLDTPPVEIGLGVLREPMARLAGRVADRALTWLVPPNYTAERIVPALRAEAERTGRPAPRVAAVVHCAVDRPGRDLTRVALGAARGHLSTPHYTDMLNRAGVPVDPEDNRTGAEQLVEHGVIATGSPAGVADTLDVYRASGVDEVIVNVGGVHLTEGPGAALRDLSAVLTELETRGSL